MILNKKDFFKLAVKLAFPIMIQNLISTLVNAADTVMLGYVSQTAMSASSLANQYTFVLFCLYYGLATGTSVLCAQYWGKGDKKAVERIVGLAERLSILLSLLFFAVSFLFPAQIMSLFSKSEETNCCRKPVFESSVLFLCIYGFFPGVYERPKKCGEGAFAFCYLCGVSLCECIFQRVLHFRAVWPAEAWGGGRCPWHGACQSG